VSIHQLNQNNSNIQPNQVDFDSLQDYMERMKQKLEKQRVKDRSKVRENIKHVVNMPKVKTASSARKNNKLYERDPFKMNAEEPSMEDLRLDEKLDKAGCILPQQDKSMFQQGKKPKKLTIDVDLKKVEYLQKKFDLI